MPMLIYSPKKIVALRRERGLGQSELARKVGISAPSMWALEEGKTIMPKAATLIGIASALGVPLSAIMSDTVPTDIDGQIAAAVAALDPAHKAAILAAAQAFGNGKKPRKK